MILQIWKHGSITEVYTEAITQSDQKRASAQWEQSRHSQLLQVKLLMPAFDTWKHDYYIINYVFTDK